MCPRLLFYASSVGNRRWSSFLTCSSQTGFHQEARAKNRCAPPTVLSGRLATSFVADDNSVSSEEVSEVSLSLPELNNYVQVCGPVCLGEVAKCCQYFTPKAKKPDDEYKCFAEITRCTLSQTTDHRPC